MYPNEVSCSLIEEKSSAMTSITHWNNNDAGTPTPGRFQVTLDELIAAHVTSEADRCEVSEEWYGLTLGELIRAGRKARGLTQDELAVRVGMTKSYISRLESNAKEARLSTLHKIVTQGLQGRLEMSIELLPASAEPPAPQP